MSGLVLNNVDADDSFLRSKFAKMREERDVPGGAGKDGEAHPRVGLPVQKPSAHCRPG